MTKEYLKMADVFTLPVKDEDRESAVEVFYRMVCAPYSVEYTVSLSQYVAHAINSHDELVAEVEWLRGELSVISNALDEVDRMISERIKNGAYDLDDILVEVSYALELLNRSKD